MYSSEADGIKFVASPQGVAAASLAHWQALRFFTLWLTRVMLGSTGYCGLKSNSLICPTDKSVGLRSASQEIGLRGAPLTSLSLRFAKRRDREVKERESGDGRQSPGKASNYCAFKNVE